MIPISGFIIAKNESDRIATSIKSIKPIVDDLTVIDSGSTDDTVEIAKSLGAHVIFNQWEGYVKQKAFGESVCKHDWILNLDADEELSLALQDEICFIFSQEQIQYLAFNFKRVILHRNDLNARRWAPSDKFIRVYNRKFCNFANVKNTTTHDAVLFNDHVNSNGKIYDLDNIVYHRASISIEQMVAKANFYSTAQSHDMLTMKRCPTKSRIVAEMFTCFLKAFFLRRYFVFGFDGFIDSMIFAFARFIRLAKTRELYRTANKSKPYDTVNQITKEKKL